MKTYGEVKMELQAFLTQTADEGMWSQSQSHPDHLTPLPLLPGTHGAGGRLSPATGPGDVAQRQLPLSGIELWSSSPVPNVYVDTRVHTYT
jgi:hypothetical protein